MRIIFFNDTATTEIYTLSLHDPLPIFLVLMREDTAASGPSMLNRVAGLTVASTADFEAGAPTEDLGGAGALMLPELDRKSTRLNSSHANNSYAVFCLK